MIKATPGGQKERSGSEDFNSRKSALLATWQSMIGETSDEIADCILAATACDLEASMNERALRPTIHWILQRLMLRWRSAVPFAIAFHVLQATLLAPLLAGVLRLFLTRWGRASVGNFEIAAFLLSPTGIAALLAVGALFIATQYFEVSGLLRILAHERLPWWQALRSSTGKFHRLAYLGLLQLAVYLALAVPFLIGIGWAYWYFWSSSDLNGLIILRPPHFWKGALIAGAFLAAYLVLAASLFCRWLYAAPILCLEPPMSVIAALRESSRRARGTFVSAAVAFALWGLVQVVLTFGVLSLTHWLLLKTLNFGDASLTGAWAIGGLALLVNGTIAGALSLFSTASLAAVVLVLYHRSVPPEVVDAPTTREFAAPAWQRWASIGGVAVLAMLGFFGSSGLISDLDLDEPVELTAHRAGATHAPENSIAALIRAIEDDADWAEIDVQLTSDKELVVMHDTDLARIGGGKRQVGNVTLAEIQKLDIGTSFNARFAGERVPTLREMLTAAKGKVRLNIELKPHGKHDDTLLAEMVVAAIREADMVGECRICSQSYPSIQVAKKQEPRIPIGLIIATVIGDPTELPVDFMMVKANLATQSFVERAHAKGIRIHAWTVNKPDMVAPLLDAGVDNLITDDVPAIRAKVEEIDELNPVQRLLLRTRHALGSS